MAEIPYPSGGVSAHFDTGRDVGGPNDPQPMGQDAEIVAYLEQQRDYAHAKLQAHEQELAEQVRHHEREIDRCKRVIDSAGRAIDGLVPQAKAVTATEQQVQRGTLGGMPVPHAQG